MDSAEMKRFADFLARVISTHEKEIEKNLQAIKSANKDVKKSA